MRLLRSVLAVIVVLTITAIPASAPADVPNGATWKQVWIESRDGTMLRADLLLPKDRDAGDRHPVILSIGPYFGRNALNGASSGPVGRFRDLLDDGRVFERGYAYVQVDSRGYGGSDGCNDFGGPGEQADAESAVNWAARQPWSNGRVGMWGKSYDAWTQVMALAENPVGLKAAVIQAPLLETYRGMFMNGVHYASGWYVTPSLYAGFDLAPTSASDPAPEEFLYPAKGTLTNPHCYAQNLSMTPLPDRSLPYWRQRDIVADAARSDVPVLWSHGFNDINTKPDNFLDVYSRLRGPKRAWIGQWDHVRGNQANLVGRDGFMREAMHWFDRYLKGKDVPEYPAVEVQNGQGWWRSESEWPPEDARRTSLTVRGSTYLDGGNRPSRVTPTDYWTFTQRAPYAMHVAGVARFTANVEAAAPFANLIVELYDVSPDRSATRITHGAYRTPGSGPIEFELYPQDWILKPGHRFGIRIASTNELFMPTHTFQPVTLSKARLSLPFLRYDRDRTLEGGRARAMTSVRTAEVTREQIESGERESDFPPPMDQR